MNNGVAAVLSFVIPGLGQLYKGSLLGAFGWLFFTIMGYTFFILPGLILHFICIAQAAGGENPHSTQKKINWD